MAIATLPARADTVTGTGAHRGATDPRATAEPTRPALGVSWVAGLCAVALLPIVLLHIWGAASVDPVLVPISCYAMLPHGGYLLLLGACSLLSGAGIALAVWLGRSGIAKMVLPVLLLISFAVSFVLVGLFPTVPFESHLNSASANVHRIAAGWGVVCVPIVAGLVGRATVHSAKSVLPRALIRLAIAFGIVVALFMAIHLPLFLITGTGLPAFGLLERFGFAIIIASLVLAAVTVRVEAYAPARPRTATDPTPIEDDSAPVLAAAFAGAA